MLGGTLVLGFLRGRFMKFLTSPFGVVLLASLALFTWHHLDKRSAVREAVIGYVADVELAAAEAEADKLRRTLSRLQSANENLTVRIEAAEKETADAQDRIAEFVQENPAQPGCFVSPEFLDLLRAN